MKTDDLIAALAMDLPIRRTGHLARLLAASSTLGLLAAVVGVVLTLQLRADLNDAMGGAVFWAKAGYTIVISLAAFWLLDRAGRPGASVRVPIILLGLIALSAACAAGVELLTTPENQRAVVLMGRSARVCPLNIAGLGVLAAPALVFSAHRFAPERPGLAGAALGLLAGALAATAYGLHCPERTAAFVAVWYSLGMIVPAVVGAAVGRLVWRW